MIINPTILLQSHASTCGVYSQIFDHGVTTHRSWGMWPPNFIMLKYIHLVHKFTAPPSFVAIAYTIQWTLLCQQGLNHWAGHFSSTRICLRNPKKMQKCSLNRFPIGKISQIIIVDFPTQNPPLHSVFSICLIKIKDKLPPKSHLYP